MSKSVRLLLVAASLLWGPSASGEDLVGRIALLDDSGASSPEVQNAVVYFTPDTKVPVEPLDEVVELVTVRKEFTPRIVTIPVGSTVRFPNEDPILHNVFSVSGPNRFDLGLYRRGEGKEVSFRYPGVVRIFCNVHHSMVAYVVVLETPFFTHPEVGGTFRLSNLPAGDGKLTVWHERSEAWMQKISLPLTGPLDVEIQMSKPRVPKHRNKFGKPYARKRRGRSYG